MSPDRLVYEDKGPGNLGLHASDDSLPMEKAARMDAKVLLGLDIRFKVWGVLRGVLGSGVSES